MRLVDQGGLDALTIRALGDDLGVVGMATYRHFRSKAELLEAIPDAVFAAFELPEETSPNGNWEEFATALMRRLYDFLTTHPSLLQLFASHRVRLSSSHQFREVCLRALRTAGFGPEEAARAYGAMLSYTLGAALLHVFLRDGSADPEAERERQGRLAYEALPLDAYPTVVALAPHLASLSSGRQFDFGLERLIRGLQLELAPAVTPRPVGTSPGRRPTGP